MLRCSHQSSPAAFCLRGTGAGEIKKWLRPWGWKELVWHCLQSVARCLKWSTARWCVQSLFPLRNVRVSERGVQGDLPSAPSFCRCRGAGWGEGWAPRVARPQPGDKNFWRLQCAAAESHNLATCSVKRYFFLLVSNQPPADFLSFFVSFVSRSCAKRGTEKLFSVRLL